MGRKIFQKITASIALSGIILSLLADIASAGMLKNGNINGLIRNNSPTFRFRNQSRMGSPLQTAAGEEYIFQAKQGDTLNITVDVQGGNLTPVLVLISSETGRQVAYNDIDNALNYQVTDAGEYRLLVLGQNSSRGRYTLTVSGLSEENIAQNNNSTPSTNTTDAKRQLLQNDYGLTVLDSCPPNTNSLAVINFVEYGQNYRYCARPNRVYPAGEYTFDVSSNQLKPGAPVAAGMSNTAGNTDPRKQILQNDFGLRVLNSCPPSVSSLTVVNFPETGQNYRYCANANRVYPAGEYTYDAATQQLKPGGNFAGNSASDPRRVMLENEYGLKVLDSCPAVKSGVVSVLFPEVGQTFCANPNRVYPAGEYTYNANTRNLDSGSKKQERCTVSVGGVCVVR